MKIGEMTPFVKEWECSLDNPREAIEKTFILKTYFSEFDSNRNVPEIVKEIFDVIQSTSSNIQLCDKLFFSTFLDAHFKREISELKNILTKVFPTITTFNSGNYSISETNKCIIISGREILKFERAFFLTKLPHLLELFLTTIGFRLTPFSQKIAESCISASKIYLERFYAKIPEMRQKNYEIELQVVCLMLALKYTDDWNVTSKTFIQALIINLEISFNDIKKYLDWINSFEVNFLNAVEYDVSLNDLELDREKQPLLK